MAAAVGPELTYVKVRQGDEVFYLSKGTLHMLRGEYEVLGELQGSRDGRLDLRRPVRRPAGRAAARRAHRSERAGHAASTISAAQAHQVIPWDEVGETEGTGIVHIAPGCGAEDFQLGKRVRPARWSPRWTKRATSWTALAG